MTSRTPPPYWLAGGAERCELCEQSYVLEMEIRCVACDCAMCPHCVILVWASRDAFCSACREAEPGPEG